MKKILTFIIKNITGSDKFEVSEIDEDGRVTLEVNADKDIVGLIIGKEGKTIKNIRRILSVKAAMNNQAVNITVNPED